MNADNLTTQFCQGLGVALHGPLGLAVSGGGDSMAMLDIAARVSGVDLHVVTVNHGLRAEAADEAAMVARRCAELNIPHRTLHWQHEGIDGNLQDQARRARYRLIAEWAAQHGIPAIALAHTQDDVAETFLMRLSRGAGVDGLAAMSARWDADGVTWLRPLLAVGRQDLRAYLTNKGLSWVEDPSNTDPAFLRVRARAALASLGIEAETLASVARNMTTARDTLRYVAAQAAKRIVRLEAGGLVFDRAALQDEQPETARRMIQAAVLFLTGADYVPRAGKLSTFVAEVLAGRQATLYGCIALPQGDVTRLTREYNAVRDTVAEPGSLWDGMWRLTTDAPPLETQIRALGPDGLLQCPNWRETGIPRLALLASPSVWRQETLISAPVAGLSNGWTATLATNRVSFAAFLLSH
ncbi:hypothetical protein ACMU_04180 [Actibacterium mucosum KCTC 23349]|uniref:tRNA(Ile)-lysidine synthase n=1 Tax=Actibacterium mucosum KCTC 23349 TaxID=1454373 RepID=A0A037ZEZ6_9RHOB|nr:hypothetical protein ACMU_04180 [Actibacterium mucosum KCTC 23349]